MLVGNVSLALNVFTLGPMAHATLILYINSLHLSVTELGSIRSTGPGPAFLAGQSLRPSVTELGSVTEGRPSPARHSQTPGFPLTGPVVGGAGPGPSQKAGRVHHRRPAGSLVPCTGGTGTAVLWFLARAVRARPFSGSQHGRSVAWRRSAALLQARKEEEEDRGKKRREERS